MKKKDIVKENRDFQDIIKTGNLRKDKNLVIYYKDNNINKTRFGISVGKKVGNAVTRNLYKRRLRNIIDDNKKLCSNSKDYIIIVKKNCLDASYQDIENSFKRIILNSNKGDNNEK